MNMEEKIKEAVKHINDALEIIKELENGEIVRLNSTTDDSYPSEDLIRIVLDDLRECKENTHKVLITLGYYEDGGFYD